jgi:hypothetical protein
VIVTAHVVGAVSALIANLVVLGVRTGSRPHRMAGKVYLFSWAVLALSGALIGLRRPGISAFEVLNAIGFGCALYAYLVVVFRRRIGPSWQKRHINGMLSSMAGLWVATTNQVLIRTAVALEIPYPFWFFVLLCLLPFVVLPRIERWMTQRNAVRASTPLP